MERYHDADSDESPYNRNLVPVSATYEGRSQSVNPMKKTKTHQSSMRYQERKKHEDMMVRMFDGEKPANNIINSINLLHNPSQPPLTRQEMDSLYKFKVDGSAVKNKPLVAKEIQQKGIRAIR